MPLGFVERRAASAQVSNLTAHGTNERALPAEACDKYEHQKPFAHVHGWLLVRAKLKDTFSVFQVPYRRRELSSSRLEVGS